MESTSEIPDKFIKHGCLFCLIFQINEYRIISGRGREKKD